jgi:hypothetical protein
LELEIKLDGAEEGDAELETELDGAGAVDEDQTELEIDLLCLAVAPSRKSSHKNFIFFTFSLPT